VVPQHGGLPPPRQLSTASRNPVSPSPPDALAPGNLQRVPDEHTPGNITGNNEAAPPSRQPTQGGPPAGGGPGPPLLESPTPLPQHSPVILRNDNTAGEHNPKKVGPLPSLRDRPDDECAGTHLRPQVSHLSDVPALRLQGCQLGFPCACRHLPTTTPTGPALSPLPSQVTKEGKP
jgi:hypothetical protein